MKKIFKVIASLILVLLVIAAIPALIPDEEYSLGAKQWLDEANIMVEIPVAQNSFNALVGFSLGKDKDMVTEGAAMVAEFNKRLRQYRADGKAKPELDPRWLQEELKVSKKWSAQVDNVFEDNPIEWLAKNSDSYEKHLTDNRVLLSRYKEITTMKQFSDYLIPDMNAPFAPLSGLLTINKLNNLSIIHEYTHNRQENAINRLRESIHFSKLMMKGSRQLIYKMIAVALLQANLNTYSILQDSASYNAKQSLHIQNLNKKERSMRRVFQGEFALMSTSFYSLDKEHLGGDPSATFLEGVDTKLYFKHRKLENMAYKKVWMPLLSQEKMTLAERRDHNEKIGNGDATWWDYYLDHVGNVLLNILLSIVTPAYYGYIDRVDHIDAYISLLNIKDEILSKKLQANKNEIEKFISSFNAGDNPGYSGARFSLVNNGSELTYVIPGYSDENIPSVKLIK